MAIEGTTPEFAVISLAAPAHPSSAETPSPASAPLDAIRISSGSRCSRAARAPAAIDWPSERTSAPALRSPRASTSMTRRPPSARTRARTKPVARARSSTSAEEASTAVMARNLPHRRARSGQDASATAVGMMLAWCVPDVVTRSTSVSITARVGAEGGDRRGIPIPTARRDRPSTGIRTQSPSR